MHSSISLGRGGEMSLMWQRCCCFRVLQNLKKLEWADEDKEEQKKKKNNENTGKAYWLWMHSEALLFCF